MAQSLGSDVPFTTLTASEIYSLEMSKTEGILFFFFFFWKIKEKIVLEEKF